MIDKGSVVRYSKQKWVVTDLSAGLAIIENSYDVRAVPLTSLKEVKK